MEKGKPKKLFNDFISPSVEEWYTMAQREIKKNDLSWTTYENIPLQPIYTLENLKELKELNAFQHQKLAENRGWLLIENIIVKDEKKANRQALTSLQGGADGIEFIINEESSIPAILKEVWIDNCVLGFQIPQNNFRIPFDFIDYYKSLGKAPNDLRGWISFDPIRDFLTTGDDILGFYSEMNRLLKLSFDYPNFRPITINSGHIANSGGSLVQELSYLLSVLVEYLEGLKGEGISIKEVFKKTLYSLTVTTNFFFEISKLRAVRILVIKIAKAYGVDLVPSDIVIHTKTSSWSKSNLDIYNNIIRNTGEAMSAIMGGTDYLSLNDINSPEPGELSTIKRAGRNISHILKEESFLDKVIDPAAGSYYIESLTQLIEETAWEEFLKIEKEGGIIKAIKKGAFVNDVQKVNEKKLENIDLRKDLIIGVNIFPNQTDQMASDLFSNEVKNKGLLVERTASSGIEQLRNMVTVLFQNLRSEKPKAVLINFSSEEIPKETLSLLKNTFNSAGFIFDHKGSKENLQKEANNNSVIIGYLDDSTIIENFNEFIGNSAIVFTSSTPLNLPGNFKGVYEPVEQLVLIQNLIRIISNLNVSK